jgi:cysteine desulfurase family protein (TIGR01976 family)
MPYDIGAVRSHFPSLESGVAHFDGPGGSQVPASVADAVRATLVSSIANRGATTAAERFADDVVVRARRAMADLLGAAPEGIVFGRSMTQLTYDFSRTIAKDWQAGDEVVVTRLDHDANIRPWVQAAHAVGAVVRWADFDPGTGELAIGDIARVLSDRTRAVAVTGASNLIGARPPIAEISALAHSVGALCFVDGVHLTAHCPVDISELGTDLYACSPYKFLGPHCGVIAGRPDILSELRPDKLAPSSDEVPERFELGTLPYELLAGTTAAVDFLAGLADDGPADRRPRLQSAMRAVEAHEDRLRRRIEQGLVGLPGVVVYAPSVVRTPTLLLGFENHSAAAAHRYLASLGVNAPAGAFYALVASRHLGLGDTGGLRVGLAPYSDDSDVDRLLGGLADFLRT